MNDSNLTDDNIVRQGKQSAPTSPINEGLQTLQDLQLIRASEGGISLSHEFPSGFEIPSKDKPAGTNNIDDRENIIKGQPPQAATPPVRQEPARADREAKKEQRPPAPQAAPLEKPPKDPNQINPGKIPDPFDESAIAEGVMAGPVSYQPMIAPVFGNAVTEVGDYHHQINDVNLREVARQQGIRPDEPLILCNFDTHSDIHTPPHGPIDEAHENVGNWVNGMIAANPQITDFYWVMPNSLRNYAPTEGGKVSNDPFFEHAKLNGNLIGGPRDSVVFVNNKTGVISWDKPPAGELNQYRQVGIHKRTLDEMPDMRGQHVIWTTDLDGFDNRGHDTALHAKIPWRGEEGFKDYLRQLEQRNIRPFFHFISHSHEYTTDEHKNDLNRFAAELSAASPNGGDINVSNYRSTSSAMVDRVPPYWGATVPRSESPLYSLLFQLQILDARTTHSDGAIVIGQPNEEYNAALNTTAQAYQNHGAATEQAIAATLGKIKLGPIPGQEQIAPEGEAPQLRAARILRTLDRLDGKPDGTVNIRMIEYRINAAYSWMAQPKAKKPGTK